MTALPQLAVNRLMLALFAVHEHFQLSDFRGKLLEHPLVVIILSPEQLILLVRVFQVVPERCNFKIIIFFLVFHAPVD